MTVNVVFLSVVVSVILGPCGARLQLWATDLEHSKEMVEESTEAGANLRTHRYADPLKNVLKVVQLAGRPAQQQQQRVLAASPSSKQSVHYVAAEGRLLSVHQEPLCVFLFFKTER